MVALIEKDPLAGHLNHLSPSQTAAFVELKAIVLKNALRNADDAEIEDIVLLRFLRARKFDPAAGYEQLRLTEEWRKEARVAEIYDGSEIAEFVKTTKVHPAWTGRYDRTGKPVYLYKISVLTKEVIEDYDKVGEKKLQSRMIALYEHMAQFALPFASALPRDAPYDTAPISSTVTLVDVSDVSLSRFWSLRPHMSAASVLASMYYAETLGRIIIVGTPFWFSTVWNWICKWFDEATVAKITIVSDKDLLATLSLYIDPVNIPTAYGGQLSFTYGIDRPNLDETAKKVLGLDVFPDGPLRWIDGELVLKGVGREEGEVERLEEVNRARRTTKEDVKVVEKVDGLDGVVEQLEVAAL